MRTALSRMTSRWAWLVLALLSVASGEVGQRKAVNPEERQAAMGDLYRRVAERGVITLNDENYRYYITENPRPYHVIALFTASAAKYQCAKCSGVEQEFSTAAQSYFKKVKRPAESPLFFVRLDFDTSKKTFQDYDFKGVPIIIHSGAYPQGKPFEVDVRDKFAMHGVVDAEAIARYASQKTGMEITIHRSPWPLIILMILLLSGLAACAKYLINMIPSLLKKVQNKWLWVAASACIYACSISGFIFDIIRNPPPFYMDPRSGQIMFFHPQSGQQFVVEGFIIGALNVLCAACVIVLMEFSASNRLKDEKMRQNVAYVCLVLFAFFFYQVFALYRMKNRWYMRI